ncbi:hypothetical protein [Phormidesmis sp. 146-33]
MDKKDAIGAEDQKRRTRRTQKNGLSNVDGERDSRTGHLGGQSGSQSIGTDHPTGTRQNSGASRLESLGGIYSQLLEEAEEQLAELEDRLEETKTKTIRYEQKIEKVRSRRQQILESLESWRQTLQG